MIWLKVKGITVPPSFIIFVIVRFFFSFFASSSGVAHPSTEELVRRSGRKTCKPAAVSGRLFQRFSGQALHTAVLSVTDLCVSTLCLSFRVPASSMPSCLDLGEDVCDCVLPERLKQVTCRRTCCAMVLCLAQRRSVTVESPRELADRDFGGSLPRESVLVTAVSTGPCSRRVLAAILVGLSSRRCSCRRRPSWSRF